MKQKNNYAEYICVITLGTFGYSKKKKPETITYSLKERDLVDAYRKNINMQAAVDKLLDLDK